MRKVLFVDDQREILDIIDIKLRDESYEKFYATSASEALDILRNKDIDVVVSDIMMPDMNGLDLLSKAREIKPETIRIVLSGNSQVDAIISAINEGNIYKYIMKPWKIDNEAKLIIREAISEADKVKGR
ncbi:MAG: response regulator [Firmicutes bacterium]|jgi:DNA-binding NtrC family response regulator|nr:response regulator [Bacillota bacterium]